MQGEKCTGCFRTIEQIINWKGYTDHERQKVMKSPYWVWLRAAYLYYLHAGENTVMDDTEWTTMAQIYYRNKANYPEKDYPIIHHPDFNGSSLYFLKEEDYPESVRNPE